MKNDIKKYDIIDIGKFIASYGVAVAHVVQPDSGMLYRLIQVGLMAYFFFASGFTFKEDINNVRFVDRFIKNFKNLIIPYLIVSLVGIIFCYIFPGYYSDVNIKNIFKNIFLIGFPYYFGLAWFLICMFWVNNLFFIIWKAIYKSKYNLIFLILVILILYFINIYLINNRDILPLPLKIDSAITGEIFFIIGFLCKKYKLYTIFGQEIKNYILSIILIIITGISKYIIETKYLGYSNITAMVFGCSYILYIIEQIIGIIHILSLSCILQKFRFLARWGSLNLWLYLIHTNVLWFLEWIYCTIQDIDMRYAYNDLFSILILSIPTYLISLGIAVLIEKFVKK